MDPFLGTRGALARPLGLALLLLAACASAPAPKPSSAVPEILKVPGDLPRLLRAAARGVQIYVCQPKANDPAAFEWALKAPEADLFDESGAKIGKHYAGPTWEHNDGSKVVGEVVQRSPSPTPGAILWLLLRAKANEGTGKFANVKYVQRLDTKGGVAPGGCDATAAGTETRVEYSANYDFY